MKRASKPQPPAQPQTQPRPASEEDLNDQRHHITMSLDLSLRLMQAVADEKRRRKAAGIPGRVTESTVLRLLIDQHLPPLRK